MLIERFALIDGHIVQDDDLDSIIRRPVNEQLATLVGVDNIIPCRAEQSSRGCLIKLANGIEFLYPGELKKPVTACCLSGDTFDFGNTTSKPDSVVIEGLVERVLSSVGMCSIWVKVGGKTLIARVPRSHIPGNVHRYDVIKLAFNTADAHFV